MSSYDKMDRSMVVLNVVINFIQTAASYHAIAIALSLMEAYSLSVQHVVMGKGASGTVYHGWIYDETEVAVKMLSSPSAQGYLQFQVETMVAIREVTKYMIRQPQGRNGNNVGIAYDRFIVISIGTGSNKSERKYNAKMVAKWGALTWLFNSCATPVLDCFNEASTDMVDYHNSVLFSALQSQDNYLRIQDDTLEGEVASVDISTKDNLNNLVKAGENLLKKKFTRVNLDSGVYETVPDKGTIQEELNRFASLLSEIRKAKKSKHQNGK